MDCTTHFFRAKLKTRREAPHAVNDADYNEGVAWVELANLRQALGFHPIILEAVMSLIDVEPV